MSKDVLITDLGCAEPDSMIIDTDGTTFTPVSAKEKGRWRLIEYATELYSGRYLQASDPDAVSLTIPLGVGGVYALSVGITATGVKTCETSIEVRLTGDTQWQLIRTYEWNSMVEEPWIIADLTGKSMEVRYPRSPTPAGVHRMARIFSVRLTAVDPHDVRRLQSAERTRAMFVCDGNGIYYSDEAGLTILDDYFNPFAGSEWRSCCFGSGGSDLVLYDTAVGTIWGEGAWDCEPSSNKPYLKVREMIDSGVDPLRAAIDRAHAQDTAILIYMRNQLWTCEPPLDQFRSKFYSEHPEYCCVEADGTVLGSKLSIGFPEVRRQMNAILTEAVDRGADGVALCFVRGFPLVRYEEPVRAMYRDLFGGDAREAEPDDERIRRVWSLLATQWIREIRAILDGAGSSPLVQKCTLAVFGGPSLEWNLQYGIDVRSWAADGLIDVVIPYPRGCETDYAQLEAGMAGYAEALLETDVQLLPSMGSFADHRLSLREYRERAHRLYEKGATGLSRWDTPHWMTNLGWDQPELQRLWVESYAPPSTNTIVSLAGLERIRFTPRIGV